MRLMTMRRDRRVTSAALFAVMALAAAITFLMLSLWRGQAW
jgi:hypothetical protein